MYNGVTFTEETIMKQNIGHYAKLMNQCGTWAIARMLAKKGFPVGYAKFVRQYADIVDKRK